MLLYSALKGQVQGFFQLKNGFRTVLDDRMKKNEGSLVGQVQRPSKFRSQSESQASSTANSNDMDDSRASEKTAPAHMGAGKEDEKSCGLELTASQNRETLKKKWLQGSC